MRQLTGLDASFLYIETKNAPMHVGGLAIYDPRTAPGGKIRFKEILENINNRVQQVPIMTSHLKMVPFGVDHPYWVDGGVFDPEFHVRHLALPAPGDWRQLCILISRIHARPLDRKRPLWEIYIIEGLDNVEGYPKGCFASYSKMHHAAIDGASGVEISALLHDLEPMPLAKSVAKIESGERSPRAMDLLLKAQINTLKMPFRLLKVVKASVPGVYTATKGVVSGHLKLIGNAPRTRFNTTVSPYRVFSAIKVEFEAIRAIKNSFRPVTVNDVALTIVGGALRKYLKFHDELPESSLLAMAPINVRSKDKLGNTGNEVSKMNVKLRTDIADAAERLLAVYESTRNAKELSSAVGAKTMTDYSQFIPSTVTASAARLASSFGLANRFNMGFNCVVTNVPGPPVPLYNTGAQMLGNFFSGPVQDGVGLFHAITSYCGELTISFTACREMIPDPDFYQQCLQESFDDLFSARLLIQQVGAKS